MKDVFSHNVVSIPVFLITGLVDLVLWGGSVEEHAFAQEDAWKNILEHFRNHLSPILKEKIGPSSKL